MIRSLSLVLALAAPVAAQSASVTYYGSACPDPLATIQVQGLPQLGTTVTIDTPFTGGCAWANICGASFVVFGLAPASIPASAILPAPWGGGSCLLEVTPDLLVPGAGFPALTSVSVSIPNQTALIGIDLYAQGAGLQTAPFFGFSGVTDAAHLVLGT